jgi:hypothetical protein
LVLKKQILLLTLNYFVMPTALLPGPMLKPTMQAFFPLPEKPSALMQKQN